ncbi:phage tail protein [Glaesserella sp.]|uniref:phage tail protein n=1 Tax=Glaesserella sp. TaxID=2094731 RepID=UPI0035A02FCD
MGGSAGGGGRTPYEAPDNLKSAQRLRAIGLISLGPIRGAVTEDQYQSAFFDYTPLKNQQGEWNYQNTEINYRLGYQDQTPLEGFEMSEREVSVGAEVKFDHPLSRTVIDPDITRLRITLGVNALFSQNDEGDTHGSSVSFQVLINGVIREDQTIEGKSSSRFTRSYIIDNLPPRPFTVTVKRITPDSKSQRLQNGTFWSSYTEIIDTKLSYPNMAIVGVKTDSRYNPNFPNLNFLLYGRLVKVPVGYDPDKRTYAGGIWRGDFKLAWTNNPAWVFYDLVTNKLAGLGQRLGDYGIDKFQLYQIAKYCDELVDDGFGGKEPRMTANLWITEQRSAYEVVSDMASVFRAIVIWNGTQLTAIQDRPADPVCTYTQSNVIEGKFNRQYVPLKSIYTAVEVEYADENNQYQKAIEYISDDAMIARYGYNVKKIQAFACTSRGQARRYGKWVLETSRLEQCTITFSVGREGLLTLPGDIIEVADKTYANVNIGGRVIAVSGRNVTLDAPIEVAGEKHLSYLINDNNVQRLTRIKITQVNANNKSIVTLESVPTGLEVMDTWALHTPLVSTQRYRVLGVTENEDGSYAITALQHEPQKEAIVDGSASFVPISDTTHNGGVSAVINADATVTEGGVKLTWSQPFVSGGKVTYEIRLYRNGKLYSTHLGLESPEFTFDNLPDGSYTAEIRARNAQGQLSNPVTRSFEINLRIPRFVTKSLLFAIELNWDLPKTATVGNYTEIWRSSTDDITKAVKVATLAYPQNSYTINGVSLSESYYFFARCGDKNGNKGEFTEGVFGEADHNPDTLLNALEGQITKSHLGESLINSLKGDIDAAVDEEAELRRVALASVVGQIQAETRERVKAIEAEAAARGNAIATVETVNAEQARQIATVTAQAGSALSGLQEERQARIDADKAESAKRETLTAKVDNIGGVNILVDCEYRSRLAWDHTKVRISQNMWQGRFTTRVTSTADGQGQRGIIQGNDKKLTKVKQGETYTLSLHAQGTAGFTKNGLNYVYLMRDEGENFRLPTIPITNSIRDPHKVTFVAPWTSNTVRVLIGHIGEAASDDWFSFHGVKLERGSVATDWSPTPSDVNSMIDSVSADLTAYKSTQATKEQAQTVAFNGLTARMGTAEGTLETIQTTKANKDEVASIAQTALQSTWKADAQQTVDALKIGGRNLLLDSEFKSFLLWGGTNYTNASASEYNGRRVIRIENKEVAKAAGVSAMAKNRKTTFVKDKKYVLSFYARGNANLNYVHLMRNNSGFQRLPEMRVPSEETFEKVELKFIAKNGVEVTDGYLLMAFTNFEVGKWVECHSIKIEEGDVATTWTPAPEDLESVVSESTAKITALSETVSNHTTAYAKDKRELVARIDGAESRITTTSEAVTGLNGKVSAMHTVKTQTIAGGRTAIAGVAMGTDSAGESSVIVMADKFGIVANANDSNVKPVFSVANGQVGIRGDLVVAGSVTRDKLSSGAGGNLLYNPQIGQHGWRQAGHRSGAQIGKLNITHQIRAGNGEFHPNVADETWSVLAISGSHADINALADNAKNNWVDNIRCLVPVTPNKWYMFSAYVGGYHCGAQVLIEKYSADGNSYLGFIDSTAIIGQSDAVIFSGDRFEIGDTSHFQHGVGLNAKRAFVKFRAPDTGKIMIIHRLNRFAKNQGYQDAYLCRPMLEECSEHTSEPSAWQNAGVSVVHGGSILANTIRGEHIQANQEIRAPNINGGNLNIGNGNFMVDSSGNMTARRGTFSGTVTGSTINAATINGGTINGAHITGITVEAENIIGDVVKAYHVTYRNTATYVHNHVMTLSIPASRRLRAAYLMPVILMSSGHYSIGAGERDEWEWTSTQNASAEIRMNNATVIRNSANGGKFSKALQGTFNIPPHTVANISIIVNSTYQGLADGTQFVFFVGNA